MTDVDRIRGRIRSLRRKLDAPLRIVFSNDICDQISQFPVWKTAEKVALFRSFDGEVNVSRLVEQALDEEKQVFLPIVETKGQPLKFAWYDRQSMMETNRYGIPEPCVPAGSLVEGRSLDLVITPLVAFDDNCNRIGMGGGFYDRTFAFRKSSETTKSLSQNVDQQSPSPQSSPSGRGGQIGFGIGSKPLLMGVAFELQKVDHIEAQPWDVPLDFVVTEAAVYERK